MTSRRQLVRGAATAVAVYAATGGLTGTRGFNWLYRNPSLPPGVFALGVASGDPDDHSVVLWTRLAPDPLHGGGMPAVDVPVRYEVAEDEGFTHIVKGGQVRAQPRWAHSVHVTVGGLRPDAWYWYRFMAGDEVSPLGRARTAPLMGRGDRLRFLFASCQSWTVGFYSAWNHAVAEQPDLVVFLGDYIYEGNVGNGVRPHNSPEVFTLSAYRNRYGLYKTDPALQAVHAACPWVVTWDDHEVENNYAGLIPQRPEEAPGFAARRAAAYQAWWEHQPVRLPPPTGEFLRIFRHISWGSLARFHVLDTRQYRDDQPCGPTGSRVGCPARTDPAHTLLGFEQEEWLRRGLQGSPATYNVLANQVVLSAMPLAGNNLDQWDGYAGARPRLLEQLAATTNPVVITGDVHASGVGDVVDETPGAVPVASEFVGPSISSVFPPQLIDGAERLPGQLPHVRWVNGRQHGYVRCDVSPDRLVAHYRLVDTVAAPTSPISTATSWTVQAGHLGPQPGG